MLALAASAGLFAAEPAPALRYEVALVAPPEPGAESACLLRLTLRNDGTAPVTLVWGHTTYDDLYRFVVRRGDGTLVLSADDNPMPALAALETGDLQWLGPGQTAECTAGLGRDAGGMGPRYSFREPGTYHIEPSFHAIEVELQTVATGQATVSRNVWEGSVAAEPVVLTVAEPSGPERSARFGSITIAGEVVDTAGKPIPGARVSIEARLTGGGPPALFAEHAEIVDAQVTDAEGHFAVTRLPDASPTFVLRCSHPRFVRTGATVVNAPSRKDYSVRLVMDPGIVLRGTVVQVDGSPLAGARVSSGNGDKQAYSDARGQFEMAGVPAG